MLRKAFHIVLACLIAVPLGAGGLCCCLLGGAAHEAGATVAAPAPTGRSCCSSESEPVPPARDPGPSCPADGSENGCECPVRDLAVFAQTVAGGELTAPTPSSELAGAPHADPAVTTAPETVSTSRNPDPPPKIPLYRTLSVLRC